MSKEDDARAAALQSHNGSWPNTMNSKIKILYPAVMLMLILFNTE